MADERGAALTGTGMRDQIVLDDGTEIVWQFSIERHIGIEILPIIGGHRREVEAHIISGEIKLQEIGVCLLNLRRHQLGLEHLGHIDESFLEFVDKEHFSGWLLLLAVLRRWSYAK